MTYLTLAFIGGGNMARSLVGGLIDAGWPTEQIRISDPDTQQCERLNQEFAGIRALQDNREAVAGADIVVFAVKPQILRAAALGVAASLADTSPLIISIAAGIRTQTILGWLDFEHSIVRCMPNTPALVKSGATGLFASHSVTQDQRAQAESIMHAVGITLWVHDEDTLDIITALSGSGPAYFLLVMEAIESAGISLGLSQHDARLLTLQTAFGTAKLALESHEDPAILRERVTSPGGTTEQGIAQLEQGNLREHFRRALDAAAVRSRELAEQSGK